VHKLGARFPVFCHPASPYKQRKTPKPKGFGARALTLLAECLTWPAIWYQSATGER
jgi:hypothetical protein